jgi:exopolyphosphatase/guanosine-5'-triphosphate,3'-diphosphate pyrophosphatase
MLARVDSAPRDVAVIDIGSNSIRLVLYRLDGRAIWTQYNEKVLAGLGRDLPATARLSPQGVVSAMAALRRFKAVLDSVDPAGVHVVATAAVREAVDGPAFVNEVKAVTGLSIRVLTGEEEAHYSALGVAAGIPHATGVAGDLGGYSLELINLAEGQPGEGATLALGPFALGAANGMDRGALRAEVKRRLSGVSNQFKADTLYAIGGAWRNLALLHMRMTNYPLQIVHEYEIAARDALEASRFIASQSRSSLERTEGLSKKRVESIPHAALVLETLIEELALEKIVTSAWGLREGLVVEALTPEVFQRDPLIEGCAALGARQAQAEAFGAALQAWIEPVFSALEPLFDDGRDPVLAAAACRLAEFGSALHPDHRADLVFDQVLRAPIAGMNHIERAFLAAAAFARHTGANVVRDPQTIGRLLSYERLQRARALGAAMRLGCDLSGRSPPLLALSRLRLEGKALVLSADPAGADLLLGEQTRKRAETLASVLGRELVVRAD